MQTKTILQYDMQIRHYPKVHQPEQQPQQPPCCLIIGVTASGSIGKECAFCREPGVKKKPPWLITRLKTAQICRILWDQIYEAAVAEAPWVQPRARTSAFEPRCKGSRWEPELRLEISLNQSVGEYSIICFMEQIKTHIFLQVKKEKYQRIQILRSNMEVSHSDVRFFDFQVFVWRSLSELMAGMLILIWKYIWWKAIHYSWVRVRVTPHILNIQRTTRWKAEPLDVLFIFHDKISAHAKIALMGKERFRQTFLKQTQIPQKVRKRKCTDNAWE